MRARRMNIRRTAEGWDEIRRLVIPEINDIASKLEVERKNRLTSSIVSCNQAICQTLSEFSQLTEEKAKSFIKFLEEQINITKNDMLSSYLHALAEQDPQTRGRDQAHIDLLYRAQVVTAKLFPINENDPFSNKPVDFDNEFVSCQGHLFDINELKKSMDANNGRPINPITNHPLCDADIARLSLALYKIKKGVKLHGDDVIEIGFWKKEINTLEEVSYKSDEADCPLINTIILNHQCKTIEIWLRKGQEVDENKIFDGIDKINGITRLRREQGRHFLYRPHPGRKFYFEDEYKLTSILRIMIRSEPSIKAPLKAIHPDMLNELEPTLNRGRILTVLVGLRESKQSQYLRLQGLGEETPSAIRSVLANNSLFDRNLLREIFSFAFYGKEENKNRVERKP